MRNGGTDTDHQLGRRAGAAQPPRPRPAVATASTTASVTPMAAAASVELDGRPDLRGR